MVEYTCPAGETARKDGHMLYHIKWTLIEFLIRHNVLAVERVRADGGRGRGYRR